VVRAEGGLGLLVTQNEWGGGGRGESDDPTSSCYTTTNIYHVL
jgi:hypothetical protein